LSVPYLVQQFSDRFGPSLTVNRDLHARRPLLSELLFGQAKRKSSLPDFHAKKLSGIVEHSPMFCAVTYEVHRIRSELFAIDNATQIPIRESTFASC
jgi:hypothetical protein